MGIVEFVALLLAGIGPLLALSHVLRLPATIILFGAGLGLGLLLGPAPLRMDPDLAIWLFLPPVIYAAAVRITPHLLRHALLPGVCVGLAVVLATVLGVAAAAHALLLPGLSWPACLLLGIVAALFDTRLFTRLFQEVKGTPHVPRAVADALKAREIASRVVALTALALVTWTIRKGAAPTSGQPP